MAQVDYFLKLDGVTGESTDDKHKGEIEIEAWKARDQLRQQRHQHLLAERGGRIEPQRARRLAAHAFGFCAQRLHLVDDAPAPLVQRVAIARKAHLSCRAVQ